MGTSTDSSFNSFYDNFKSSNMELLAITSDKLNSLTIDSLLTVNAAVTDTNTIESNQKTVNAIQLTSLADSAEYSSSDTTDLTTIAWQSSLTGGSAVYAARAMLFLEIHETIPELRLMQPLIPDSLAELPMTNLNTLSVYPNPTHNILNILKNEKLTIKKIELLDVVGKRILTSTTTDLSFDISWLEEGIYYIRVFDSNDIPWHGSFVKVK